MEIEDYINENTVINDEIYKEVKDSIICLICQNIIINPLMCMICKNTFCKKCINQWTKRDPKCPIKCKNPNYQENSKLALLLSKLKFKCNFCNNTSEYNAMKNHFSSGCDNFKRIKNSLEKKEKHQKEKKFQKLPRKKNQILESKYRIKSKK